uniref:Reverse transcriptase zinc-binding domain-containing protein n=1 Tax=Opuntia streptacantha TaxID=393608 RepID=A0A7C8ZN81_OPUST
MPKIKIFLSQMCHNVLSVRGTLFRRGCQLDPQCPLCRTDIESTEHLFQDCPQIQTVWTLAHQHRWNPPPKQLLLILVLGLPSWRLYSPIVKEKHFNVLLSCSGAFGK